MMALQANGITVLRVATTQFGQIGSAPCIEFLVGSAQVKLVWDAHQGEFIVRQPMWSDGRRNGAAPEFTKNEWKAIFTQAYGISQDRSW